MQRGQAGNCSFPSTHPLLLSSCSLNLLVPGLEELRATGIHTSSHTSNIMEKCNLMRLHRS